LDFASEITDRKLYPLRNGVKIIIHRRDEATAALVETWLEDGFATNSAIDLLCCFNESLLR
jgi:hypothetical protein